MASTEFKPIPENESAIFAQFLKLSQHIFAIFTIKFASFCLKDIPNLHCNTFILKFTFECELKKNATHPFGLLFNLN